MSLTRRSALGLFGLSALGTTLAACAPTTNTPAPAGTEGLKDDGVKEFPLSLVVQRGRHQGTDPAQIDKYTAANAGTKISTPSYPYNDYLNQLLLQVQGGQLTGAVQLDVAWLATLAATGKLLDLKSIAAGLDYAPAALALGQSGGVQYGCRGRSPGSA